MFISVCIQEKKNRHFNVLLRQKTMLVNYFPYNWYYGGHHLPRNSRTFGQNIIDRTILPRPKGEFSKINTMSWKVVQNFQTDYPSRNVLTICNSSPQFWNLDLIELVLVFFGKLRLLSKRWNDQSEQNLLSSNLAYQLPSRTEYRSVESDI